MVRPEQPPNPTHNNINTRAEIIEYDPALAALLDEVYGDASVTSSCHETDDSVAHTVEGVVLGPDGQPLEDFLLWLWPGNSADSAWAITDEDGLFFTRVASGYYVIHLYGDRHHDCSFIGWHGGEGVTARVDQAVIIHVDDADVEDFEIKLHDDPANFPYIEWCAN
ncbi:MAG: carboxypeptidase regulatory-like domain-containing protein [Acidimicrobiia bacterium]|nr:carboxypeptidase regulatory-like domain-containing protein [Acidimicrobiia bacterium]MYB74250.1 carboxypeptidase regulatory-like domain-containing protein [Acidimicrobiia bacterium]MYH98312.1 carboxypeptidase regulatory-like domain-containing protein [Acidimicrobiia bacterium]